jgi:uncharacterized membrane protein
MARLESSQIVRAAATADNNPPLYYLILHWFTDTAGSDKEIWLRAPSVFFGIVGMLATFLVARRLGGPLASLWATALVALSVFHVEHSREARMYTLLYAAATLSVYAFLRLGVGGRRDSVLWAICTLATLFAHTVGLFVLLAQNVCWLTLRVMAPATVQPLRKWLYLNLAVAVAATPWAWVVVQQRDRMGGVFWISPPYLSQPIDILAQLAGSFLLLVILLALACIGFAAVVRNPQTTQTGVAGLFVLLIWGSVPLLIPWLASYVSVPILIPRVAIACLAPLYIAAAFGLAALRPYMAIIPAAAVLLISGHLVWQHINTLSKENWRSLVTEITPQLAPDDLLLFHESSRRKGFQYYMPSPRSELAGFPERRFAAGETLQPSELQALQRIVEGRRRVWLVLSSSNDPNGLIQQALSRNFTMMRRREYRRLAVEEFVKE